MSENKPLVEMSAFFNAVSNNYDTQQVINVGGSECYKLLSDFLPKNSKHLLDIGIGTGLELAGLFDKCPDLSVTGIDMAEDMLKKLKEKYQGKNITVHKANYLTFDYPYDTPCTVDNEISMMTCAGFHDVKVEWQHECTVIITARK